MRTESAVIFYAKMKNIISLIFKNLAHPAGIIGLVVALAIPFLIYLGPNVGHKEIIRLLDLKLPLPLFLVQFGLGILLLFSLNKDFRNWFKSILPEKPVTLAALISAIAIAVFAGTQIEARHRVQSDESVFMAVAQNMYHNHISATCNQGEFNGSQLDCTNKSNSFKSKGLAFLYVLGMPLFGTDLHWIFKAELLLLPLAFLMMFLAIVAWTRQPLLAFFAALLMALQPTVLFQFRSMSVEPLYIFLSALSLLVFKWAFARNTIQHWALLALTLAFFAQTRQETVFCLLPFILFSLPKLLDKKDFKAPVFFVLLSLFSAPVLLTISYFQGFGFQGGEFSAHGHFIEDLVNNWKIMTKPLSDKGELVNPFLTYFNWLFLAGLLYLIYRALIDFRKGNKFYLGVLVFLALYHIQTYMILENVSGDFGIEINQRYSLVMIPSMAFLAALPVAHLIEYFSYDSKTKKQTSAALVLGLLFTLLFAGWTFHYKEDFNKNVMYNRNHLTTEEQEIWKWLNEQAPGDKLFIYGRPWHFVAYGVSAFHYDRVRQMDNGQIGRLLEKYNGEVYYIRGLDCWDSQTYHKKAVEHRIPTTCDVFEREMDLEGVKNVLITNNYWVQIAKFKGRKNYNPTNIIQVSEPARGMLEDSSSVAGPLLLNYRLKEQAGVSENWIIRVVHDRVMIRDTAYVPGDYNVLIAEDMLQPGYNTFRFIVMKGSKVLAQVGKTFFNETSGAKKLIDLQYESHRQEWGDIGINKSIEGKTLTINGHEFKEGIATHAASETIYDIAKQFKIFRAVVGLDDESLCSEGVSVQAIGDDKVLAETPVFKAGYLHALNANVEGVQKLTLKTIAKGSIDCSHVDIVNPVLIP